MSGGTLPPIDEVLELRDAQWGNHPIVAASAVLPTPAVLFVLGVVSRIAKRHRKSVAFWAHPLSGKSSCIETLNAFIAENYPGAGVFNYEAKAKSSTKERVRRTTPKRSPQAKEREFLGDLLESMDYEPPVKYELAARRSQVQRALLAMGSGARHLFVIIDEAQELDEQEMTWMKSIINWLSKRNMRVTVVLFGQVELLATREEVDANFRSDLSHRFTHEVYQFPTIQSVKELKQMLSPCDDPQLSEWPKGSGVCYTQFLFPRAYGQGYRLASSAHAIWKAFTSSSPLRPGESGLSPAYVAAALAELADALKDRDTEDFIVLDTDVRAAVCASGYIKRGENRKPESVT